MATIGTFARNDKTADLLYGVEDDMYYISHRDNPGEPGHEFLNSLGVSNEIVLQTHDENIVMVVVRLNRAGPYIHCDAKAVEEHAFH